MKHAIREALEAALAQGSTVTVTPRDPFTYKVTGKVWQIDETNVVVEWGAGFTNRTAFLLREVQSVWVEVTEHAEAKEDARRHLLQSAGDSGRCRRVVRDLTEELREVRALDVRHRRSLANSLMIQGWTDVMGWPELIVKVQELLDSRTVELERVLQLAPGSTWQEIVDNTHSLLTENHRLRASLRSARLEVDAATRKLPGWSSSFRSRGPDSARTITQGGGQVSRESELDRANRDIAALRSDLRDRDREIELMNFDASHRVSELARVLGLDEETHPSWGEVMEDAQALVGCRGEVEVLRSELSRLAEQHGEVMMENASLRTSLREAIAGRVAPPTTSPPAGPFPPCSNCGQLWKEHGNLDMDPVAWTCPEITNRWHWLATTYSFVPPSPRSAEEHARYVLFMAESLELRVRVEWDPQAMHPPRPSSDDKRWDKVEGIPRESKNGGWVLGRAGESWWFRVGPQLPHAREPSVTSVTLVDDPQRWIEQNSAAIEADLLVAEEQRLCVRIVWDPRSLASWSKGSLPHRWKITQGVPIPSGHPRVPWKLDVPDSYAFGVGGKPGPYEPTIASVEFVDPQEDGR